MAVSRQPLPIEATSNRPRYTHPHRPGLCSRLAGLSERFYMGAARPARLLSLPGHPMPPMATVSRVRTVPSTQQSLRDPV